MRNKLIFLILGAVIFIGCEKDDTRTSLLGSWHCEEIPEQSFPSNYQVNIIRNPYLSQATNEYVINNFYKLGNSQSAEVYFYQDTISGDLIINQQVVQDYIISGTGIVSDDFSEIRWEYFVSSGIGDEKVRARYY